MWHAEKAYTRFKAEATPVVAVQQLPFGYGAACGDRRVRIGAAIKLRLHSATRLAKARLVEQDRLQSAGESASVERRLRRFKIIPLTHSSDRADVLVHSSDRTHAHVRVHKREAWPFDRIGFRERDRTQGQKATRWPSRLSSARPPVFMQ